MIKPHFIRILLLSLLLVPGFPPPVALASEYACTITDVLEQNDKGQYITHGWVANYLNRKFFVDRDTGRVTGTTALKARLVNFDKTHQPQLLHQGGDGAFTAITLFEDSNEFTVLRINGKSEAGAMPYYYQTAIGMLLTGTCTESGS